ncbi:hypothetical protein RUM44_013493 [Polyplax serrata]|uniref:Uncharacterized protein n=1 Tax=Polyplax serrata TaxID=468196 RepID=A0ABR1BEB8_POLSC
MHEKGTTTSKNTLYYEFSRSTLSSCSDTSLRSLDLNSVRSHERLGPSQGKSDLYRLFERKKLKEKSLSKKVHTPFDRKLNRTCWPIELSKVCRIKKKPTEKKKRKPHYKFPRNNKFLKAPFLNLLNSDSSDAEEEQGRRSKKISNQKHFFYEPVTPQMLMDVLQDPEHLYSGATIDMIISKLRALKLDLNPTVEMLKKEVLEKLHCAMKLGMVTEIQGYYTVVCCLPMGKLPRKKVDAFWDLWYRKMKGFN